MLTGERFVAKLHLKQSGFTYSACGLFTKHRERIKKFRETCILKDLYRNELDKACVAHDATYSNSKDLAKKLLQIRFSKIKIMKSLEIVTMMDIKEH